ncbi:hypothetical protein QTO34_002754 [Cnephaeus nilssonii]|uniref:SAND domain-containing protein n=1 Tax=Cnephaeus nilssonii TaxID=3371016 RepID=A0AA40LMC8_CNENI|nr:hypothetical protein QTO34_002754 [Eptesicus nilssonii]
MDANVDFGAEILPVTCGEITGMLIKRKFERDSTYPGLTGSMVKCIRSQDGNWFTLHEFELKGGYKSCNWKNSVRCNRRTLKWLMEKEHLPKPPRIYGKIKKPENADKCKICGDEGKLFKCSWCFSFFHGDCHIPSVEPERFVRCSPFSCKDLPPAMHTPNTVSPCILMGKEQAIPERRTLAAMGMEVFLGMPHSLISDISGNLGDVPSAQYYKCLHEVSSVTVNLRFWQDGWGLKRSRLLLFQKCEFLLLKAYCHFETNVFPNIPHQNYVQKASQCLKTLKTLDKIKNNLKKSYSQVKGFVLDMNNIFQDSKHNNSEEFKKNFKEVFAIQKTNQNSSLV